MKPSPSVTPLAKHRVGEATEPRVPPHRPPKTCRCEVLVDAPLLEFNYQHSRRGSQRGEDDGGVAHR
jgi:hypothetical protein